MKVVEIFKSIDGEGIRAGLPCTFIRLFGCNLKCSYCDSRYACEGDGYREMSIPQIIKEVDEYGVPNVTVTGGEPLIHPGIVKLLEQLLNLGYDVNVETNGSQFPKRIVYDTDFKLNPLGCVFLKGSLFYTMDYKCPSSGMESHMHIDILNELTEQDVLKFVVGSQEDLDKALSIIEQLRVKPQIYFSPVFDKIQAVDIVDYLLDKQLFDCKVQLQLHKYIWNPEQRGV